MGGGAKHVPRQLGPPRTSAHPNRGTKDTGNGIAAESLRSAEPGPCDQPSGGFGHAGA